ncbi:MAG: TraR/DksA family transcriptional regulator [Acidimicrobiia bacterium]
MPKTAPRTTKALAAHKANLVTMREEVTARLARARAEIDELTLTADDVGAGDDEGGAENDGTLVERDRLRSMIAEDSELLRQVEDAVERSAGRDWSTCTKCGGPIGAPRLEALPTTTVCVGCKAAGLW